MSGPYDFQTPSEGLPTSSKKAPLLALRVPHLVGHSHQWAACTQVHERGRLGGSSEVRATLVSRNRRKRHRSRTTTVSTSGQRRASLCGAGMGEVYCWS